ncbi:MAG: hypothetical protein IJ718_03580 [Paludibacteraceae bacterium]|jgi:hypothetical protein|nr:hypothetical protein [Paludibacteraceae bacterium]MBR1716687.1 hypothetical protein [Paludibacteraceae bacterium]
MKTFRFLLIAVLGIAMASCSMIGNNDPEYRVADLQGLWQENNTEHYVRFTTEQSDEAGYLYGREWDEAEDIFEADLQKYGNGWFKYLLEKTGNLTEIHLMDNGGAEIPKTYVVTKLTDTDLEYYEKEHKAITFKFQKVVTVKN